MSTPRRDPSAEDPGIRLLRWALAILLLVHGIARIRLGIVAPFGEFLEGRGFPLGFALAWGITLWELVGALVLAARRWVVPVSAVFVAELAMGIALVHWPEGWFVVGAGRNGMEYSVLLIVGFVALVVSERAGGGPREETEAD